MRCLISLALLLTIIDATHGIKVPFEIRTDGPAATRLSRRSNIPVANNGNAQYIGNVTLGGVQARVLLDTGSSDLWVSFPKAQPTATDLGKSVTLAYAVGKASGNIHSTTAELGGFKVDNQAFLLVSDTSTFSTDIHTQGYDGLLGLGPNKGSVIKKTLDGNTGDTTLTHIFQQGQSNDSYITILLDRKNDPTTAFTGQLTISEIASAFQNITSMPKLDVDTVNRLLSSDQHWQALTDKNNGIIGPDGNPIVVKSIVPSAPDGQFVAVFDSGFTFSQVPRDVSDAIYGRVQGAVYDTKDELWTIPCGQYLNVSVQFGGQSYPMHPLDTVDDNFAKKDSQGNRVCIGAFQPITSAFSLLGHYDMILGMSFLRNAYTLFDFGSWANGQSGDHPFIQLASVTNAAQARQDFINVRLMGQDTINDPRWALLPSSQMQHSPVSAEEKKKKYQELILSRWPYILAGCLVAVLGVIGFCIWRCCRRKGAKKATKSKKVNQLFSTEPASTTYLPLQGTGAGGVPQKDDYSHGLTPGGQYHAHTQSQYSLDSQYPPSAQYPPGAQYPPDAQYSGQYGSNAEYSNSGHPPPELKSPLRHQHSSEAQYPPPHYSAGHHPASYAYVQ